MKVGTMVQAFSGLEEEMAEICNILLGNEFANGKEKGIFGEAGLKKGDPANFLSVISYLELASNKPNHYPNAMVQLSNSYNTYSTRLRLYSSEVLSFCRRLYTEEEQGKHITKELGDIARPAKHWELIEALINEIKQNVMRLIALAEKIRDLSDDFKANSNILLNAAAEQNKAERLHNEKAILEENAKKMMDIGEDGAKILYTMLSVFNKIKKHIS
ncbi:hypothetical protein J4212_02365 [Candidatus Woesearchaeota archaeon]|nr:hypothetical protein [Candidatus Woesearchaeota archaeon]